MTSTGGGLLLDGGGLCSLMNRVNDTTCRLNKGLPLPSPKPCSTCAAWHLTAHTGGQTGEFRTNLFRTSNAIAHSTEMQHVKLLRSIVTSDHAVRRSEYRQAGRQADKGCSLSAKVKPEYANELSPWTDVTQQVYGHIGQLRRGRRHAWNKSRAPTGVPFRK